MTNILDKIITQKRKEVAFRKVNFPIKMLENSVFFDRQPTSLSQSLLEKSGIIAEFKRKSPSKGIINDRFSVEEITVGYRNAGARALSILTDEPFFGGKNEDVTAARKVNDCPILRKDFILEEYQILEAKAIGADAILLLANVHNPLKIRQLAQFARSLELEILLELHEENELAAICPEVHCVGVNNRNLKDFSVSLDHSFQLGAQIPADFLKVSESGLSDAAAILLLREVGFRGFLIGEYFMKNDDPAAVLSDLIEKFELKSRTD